MELAPMTHPSSSCRFAQCCDQSGPGRGTIPRAADLRTSGKAGVGASSHRFTRVNATLWRRLTALAVAVALAALPATAIVTSVTAQEASPKVAAKPADASEAEPQPNATRTVLRFLTDSDYPPFNYLDEEGTLTGFNVDVARAVCLELDVTCDIKAFAWQDLLPTLGRGEVDAVIASHAINSRTLAEADFTNRYYFTPARFASLKTAKPLEITPIGLEGVKIGVAARSAHEAYLNQFFRDSLITVLPTLADAQAALAAGQIDLLFQDGTQLVFWINGSAAGGCCELRGGAFFDDRYFGDGVGIAVRKNNLELKAQLNKALAAIQSSGRFEELLLRYFPTRVY